jgi:integrase
LGTMVGGQFQAAPKTKAGKRVIDLPGEVNSLLRLLFANHVAPLFPLSESNYRRQFAALGIPGFHSLRRFRVTHLQLTPNIPESLVKFWAGHASKGTTARYTKVAGEIATRKDWSERAGLGFSL